MQNVAPDIWQSVKWQAFRQRRETIGFDIQSYVTRRLWDVVAGGMGMQRGSHPANWVTRIGSAK